MLGEMDTYPRPLSGGGVPSLVLDLIWDFIFRMLLLEPDICMTIVNLSANSWNV